LEPEYEPPLGPGVHYHPILDGTPCDIYGNDLPPGAPPPPQKKCAVNDYSPFNSRAEFEFAEFIFAEEEMSNAKLDKHIQNLAALYPNSLPPFADHQEMHSTIDAIKEGDIPWKSFSVEYDGVPPDGDVIPPWMTTKYDVWYRDPLLSVEQQLGNPDFAKDLDFAPKQIIDLNNKRQYTDLLSGNWAWEQAVRILIYIQVHGYLIYGV
jgi:hypothetical protein